MSAIQGFPNILESMANDRDFLKCPLYRVCPLLKDVLLTVGVRTISSQNLTPSESFECCWDNLS